MAVVEIIQADADAAILNLLQNWRNFLTPCRRLVIAAIPHAPILCIVVHWIRFLAPALFRLWALPPRRHLCTTNIQYGLLHKFIRT